MAVQILYPDGNAQWLPGELFQAHDGFTIHNILDKSNRDFGNDHRVISTCPDYVVINWDRRTPTYPIKMWGR